MTSFAHKQQLRTAFMDALEKYVVAVVRSGHPTDMYGYFNEGEALRDALDNLLDTKLDAEPGVT